VLRAVRCLRMTSRFNASSKPERELVEAKLSQGFDATPRSKNDADNNEPWKKASEFPEFRSKAEDIAHLHLQDEAQLDDKYQQDLKKLGSSPELDAVYDAQQKLQACHYDEDRGRYAREFLKARELAEEFDEREKEKALDLGNDLEP
jgi:hypothetical protein